MDGIGTDRGCPRCGEQIRLVIATPGPDSTTDPLLRLLNIGLNDQAILLAHPVTVQLLDLSASKAHQSLNPN